jgi:hypothetical protein
VGYWKLTAIHVVTEKCLRVQSIGHIDAVPRMIENLQRDKWHDGSLPFTILLDRTGETTKHGEYQRIHQLR